MRSERQQHPALMDRAKRRAEDCMAGQFEGVSTSGQMERTGYGRDWGREPAKGNQPLYPREGSRSPTNTFIFSNTRRTDT